MIPNALIQHTDFAFSEPKMNVQRVDDDEDLEALRNAALQSRKKTTNLIARPQTFNNYTNWRAANHRGGYHNVNSKAKWRQTSNLIIINTVPLEEVAPPAVLVLPQDKYVVPTATQTTSQVPKLPLGKFNRIRSNSSSDEEEDLLVRSRSSSVESRERESSNGGHGNGNEHAQDDSNCERVDNGEKIDSEEELTQKQEDELLRGSDEEEENVEEEEQHSDRSELVSSGATSESECEPIQNGRHSPSPINNANNHVEQSESEHSSEDEHGATVTKGSCHSDSEDECVATATTERPASVHSDSEDEQVATVTKQRQDHSDSEYEQDAAVTKDSHDDSEDDSLKVIEGKQDDIDIELGSSFHDNKQPNKRQCLVAKRLDTLDLRTILKAKKQALSSKVESSSSSSSRSPTPEPRPFKSVLSVVKPVINLVEHSRRRRRHTPSPPAIQTKRMLKSRKSSVQVTLTTDQMKSDKKCSVHLRLGPIAKPSVRKTIKLGGKISSPTPTINAAPSSGKIRQRISFEKEEKSRKSDWSSRGKHSGLSNVKESQLDAKIRRIQDINADILKRHLEVQADIKQFG